MWVRAHDRPQRYSSFQEATSRVHSTHSLSSADKGEVYVCGAGCSRLGLEGEQDKLSIDMSDSVAHQKTPKRVEALRGAKIIQVACGGVYCVVLVRWRHPCPVLGVLLNHASA